MNELVRVVDLKKTFSKRDVTKWSNKISKITEVVKDTKPSYSIGNLPERYNEALLKKTKLTRKENESVKKALGFHSQSEHNSHSLPQKLRI